MFRNDYQRASVCNALTYWIRGRELFAVEAHGSTAARGLLRTPLSSGETVMLRFALQVWRIGGTRLPGTKLDVSELLHRLDGTRTRMVGSLFVAMASNTPSALERWLLHEPTLHEWREHGVAPRLAQGAPTDYARCECGRVLMIVDVPQQPDIRLVRP